MSSRDSGYDLEEIIRRHADMVYRVAKLNTSQEKDAEDVFQETFLKLIKHIDTLKSEEHIKAWLLRVTINGCKSHFTSAWNKRVVVTEKEVLESYSDKGVGVHRNDVFDSVYEAVKSLPPKYRDIIHLFYFEELSIKEISSILKRSEGTVKSQLARGRERLSLILKDPLE